MCLVLWFPLKELILRTFNAPDGIETSVLVYIRFSFMFHNVYLMDFDLEAAADL